MKKEKVFIVANVGLIVISLMLASNLIGIEFPAAGKAAYVLDAEEPVCVVQSSVGINEVDLGRCCLSARQQVTCERDVMQHEDTTLTQSCYTATSAKYRLNSKAYNYCTLQAYW